MAEVRVKISSASIDETEVTPIWKGEFNYNPENDRPFFRVALAGSLIFRLSDYTLINDVPDNCETITVTIERFCGEDFETFWTGTFSRLNCIIDPQKCTISVKPAVLDAYNCILSQLNKEQIIYTAGDEILVKPFQGLLQLEVCDRVDDEYNTVPESSCIDSTDNWCMIGNNTISYLDYDPETIRYQILTTWARIVKDFPSDPGSPWTLLTGTTYFRCPDDGSNYYIHQYGRLFGDVVQYLLDQTGCGLTFTSDFFNVNPPGTAPDNAAYTYAETYLHNLTIHQKSDAKRPTATDKARNLVWTMKFEDFLDDMAVMFEAYWRIEGSDFRLEHLSYFEQVSGLDATSVSQNLTLSGEGSNGVEREDYEYLDKLCEEDFKDVPIEYSCGTGAKTKKLKLFSTDIRFIELTDNNEAIADAGYVLMSCEIVDDVYYCLDNNDGLSWQRLHETLHLWGREFAAGTVNGDPVTFNSSKRRFKQSPFTMQLCCDDDFDPNDLITTPIGDGEIDAATYSITKDQLIPTLKYN